MKWQAAKNAVKSGDLIAVSHKAWKTVADVESQIVRLACQTEYSHVAVIWVSPHGDPYVIEAVVPEVTLSPLDKYIDGCYLIQTPDKPMSATEEAYGFSKLKQPYSKIEAVEGYFDLIKIGSNCSWFCCELTIAMRRLAGLDLGPRTTPSAVVQAALAKGYTLTYISKDT